MSVDLKTKVLITRRDDAISEDTIAVTPESEPNVQLVVMEMGGRILVRAFRTFLQATLSALGVGMLGPSIPGVSDVLPPGQPENKLLAALLIGLVSALIAAAQLAFELTRRWDESHPERLG